MFFSRIEVQLRSTKGEYEIFTSKIYDTIDTKAVVSAKDRYVTYRYAPLHLKMLHMQRDYYLFMKLVVLDQFLFFHIFEFVHGFSQF